MRFWAGEVQAASATAANANTARRRARIMNDIGNLRKRPTAACARDGAALALL
jgi:hypothetical protein